VDAAMHVGVGLGVVARLALDHAARLLAGGGVVEIDQRLAMHAAFEDRKVAAQAHHVEGGALINRRFHADLPFRPCADDQCSVIPAKAGIQFVLRKPGFRLSPE
jgi:hypothetical protein